MPMQSGMDSCSTPAGSSRRARLELHVDGDVVLESDDHGLVARQAARYAGYASVAVIAPRR
jgi:hypothetical protein